MTELHPSDIIRILFKTGESRTVLITSISEKALHVKEPPNTTIVIPYKDEILENVASITILRHYKPKGYAELNGFTIGKNVKVELAGTIVYGIIESCEEDMIGISDGNQTYYIDFGYENVPLGVKIELNEAVFDQEDEYIIKPTNQHRYNIDDQMSDLLDSCILPSMNRTTLKVQQIIVLRFKELYDLYTTDLHPKIISEKSLLENHSVKWIQPIVNATRIVYDDDSYLFFNSIIEIMDSKDSYTSKYEKIFIDYVPVIKEGSPVFEIVEGLIPKATVCRSNKKNIYNVTKNWVNQVYAPFTLGKSDLIKPIGYVSHPWYSVNFSKLFLPETSILTRQTLNNVAPLYNTNKKCYTSISKNSTLQFKISVRTHEMLIPTVPEILNMNLGSFYSLHELTKQMEPFLIYSTNLNETYFSLFQPILNKQIKSYKHNYKHVHRKSDAPISISKLLHIDGYEYANETVSEWYANMMHQDNMKICIASLSLSAKHDPKTNLQDYIEKEKKPAPPLAKIYTSAANLKKHNYKRKEDAQPIYYDENLDPNIIYYPLVDKYGDNLKLIAAELQKENNLTPFTASQLAKDIIGKQKIVQQNDYAKLEGDYPAYYRRIGVEWKLDETCSGVPYACTTDSPTCIDTNTCEDSPFQLKQNLIATMVNEYELDKYTKQDEFEIMQKDNLEYFKYVGLKIREIQMKQSYKYNQNMLKLRVPITVSVSPYESILYIILQQPSDIKYAELLQFIARYTRNSAEHENIEWKYCKETNHKLVPSFLYTLANAYINDTYEKTVQELKQTSDFEVADDGIYYNVHCGLPLEIAGFKDSFDDLVRSSELEEVELLQIPRLNTKYTKLLEELIVLFTTTMKINLVPYFSFMINGILHLTGDRNIGLMIIYCLGYISALTNVYDLKPSTKHCAEDYYKCLLQYTKLSILKIVEKNDLTVKIDGIFELSESHLNGYFITISNKFEIKLLQKHHKKRTYIPTISVWTNFLPPRILHKVDLPEGKTINQLSMYIIAELHNFIQTKHPLLDQGYKKENACCQNTEIPLMDELKKIKFTQPAFQLSQVKQVPGLDQPEISTRKISGTVSVKKIDMLPFMVHPFHGIDVVKFSTEVNDHYKRLERMVDRMPDFSAWNGSTSYGIQFLRTYIQCIASVYPKYIMSSVDMDNSIPITVKNTLFGSHEDSINRATLEYYADLENCKGFEVMHILVDEDIHEILRMIKLPFHKANSDQIFLIYKMYIYSIFEKYIELDQDKAVDLLKIYIKMGEKDMGKINVSIKMINDQNLKIKLRETARIKKRLQQESKGDTYAKNMLRNINLEEEAAESRKQQYSQRAWELNEQRLLEEHDLERIDEIVEMDEDES